MQGRKMRVYKLEWELSALEESMKAAGLEKHLRSGNPWTRPGCLRLCMCRVAAMLRTHPVVCLQPGGIRG